MTNPNDPAFVGYIEATQQMVLGLTKREYFAAMALIGREGADDEISKKALAIADRLIRELNNPTQK